MEETLIAKDRHDRRNAEITVPRVRVIDEDGTQVGVMMTQDALARAQEAGLDLVEVSPNADPPVCKIMDYGKYIFQKNKTQQAARKKQKQIQIKEIKFRPNTEEADYQVKLRRLKSFLEDGDKIKATVRFRGREMAHQEIGLEILRRVREDLEELGTVESMPKVENRQMIMVMAPRKVQQA